MPTTTLRPDTTVSNSLGDGTGSAWTNTHAATNDNSDATYMEGASGLGGPTHSVVLGFATAALGAGTQIRSVAFRIRKGAGGGDNTMRVWQRVGGVDAAPDDAAGQFAIATVSLPPHTLAPSGLPWTQADVDNLQIRAQALAIGGSTVFGTLVEVYADVDWNALPTVVVTAPAEAASVTTTTTPLVGWTYADPEGDVQERVQVKIFSAAQYGAGGFDPETSAATWDSGVVYTSAASLTVGTPLANGITYRAYVKVGDATPAGVPAKWSTWDSNTFTINVTPPGVPTVNAVAAGAGSSMGGNVTSGSIPAGGSGHRFELQRSLDAGATWKTVRGYSAKQFAAGTTGAGTVVAFVDYEVPRGATVSYRARSTADVTGSPIASAFSAGTAGVLQPVDAPCGYLKSPSDPTKNIAVDVAETRLASTSDTALSVFYAEGRVLPIAHQGEVHGEDFGDMQFSFTNDAGFEAFETLRKRREVLLLQLPHGDTTGATVDREQRWVRLGRRAQQRFTYDRMNSAQIRLVTVRVVEVDEPPAT